MYDPPLAQRSCDFISDPFDAVLASDFVTMHVPLTTPEESEYPTLCMMGRREFSLMNPGAYFFNTSRGMVVNSHDLIGALRQARIAGAFLDVYEGEPRPQEELIALPELSTPHVAGYAVEGKLRGAIMVYEAVCEIRGVAPGDTSKFAEAEGPRGFLGRVAFKAGGPTALAADNALRALMKRSYDIKATSESLKATLGAHQDKDRGELFDALRRQYAEGGRHELAAYRVELDDGLRKPLVGEIGRRLSGFGIVVTSLDPHFILSPE